MCSQHAAEWMPSAGQPFRVVLGVRGVRLLQSMTAGAHHTLSTAVWVYKQLCLSAISPIYVSAISVSHISDFLEMLVSFRERATSTRQGMNMNMKPTAQALYGRNLISPYSVLQGTRCFLGLRGRRTQSRKKNCRAKTRRHQFLSDVQTCVLTV
jgi:hypothetical protein